MRMIKYITSFILFAMAFLFAGEIYISYIDDLPNTFYQTTLFKPANVSNQEMLNDINKAANENEVAVFVVHQSISKLDYLNLTIYGKKSTFDQLQDNYAIKPGQYASLFMGTADIKFKPLTSFKNFNTQETYCLIGNLANMRAFKASLVDKYDGGFPKISDSNNSTKRNIQVVWGIVFLVLLVLTYFSVKKSRKEIAIRLVFGEKMRVLIFKKILMDVFSELVLIILAYKMIATMTTATYEIELVAVFFCIFLVINTVLYLTLFKINLQTEFNNTHAQGGLLVVNYIAKVTTLVLSIVVLTTTISVISKGKAFKSQASFFKQHNQYSYIKLHIPPSLDKNNKVVDNANQSTLLRGKFFNTFSKQAIQLTDFSNHVEGLKEPVLMANRSAKRYLKTKIPEITLSNRNNTVYYFVPKSVSLTRSQKKGLLRLNELYYQTSNYQVSWQQYAVSPKLVAINSNTYFGKSTIVKRPIIIFNNFVNNSGNIQQQLVRDYFAYDILYQISTQDFKQFVKENTTSGLIATRTNAYNIYKKYLITYERSMIVATVASILIIVIDLLVMASLMNLEYSLNAMTVSLKKILGYGMISRYKPIFMVTLMTHFLTIIVSLGLWRYQYFAESIYLMIAILLVLSLDLAILIIMIRRLESQRIPKVLKGGAL